MRLIDRVVNAAPSVRLVDGSGRERLASGVGAKALEIEGCELRYILNRPASDELMNLVTSPNNGLFEPQSALLRMPAEAFWLEWFGSLEQQKLGLLVQAEPGGRQGSITGYFQDQDGRPDKVGAWVSFDLDRPRAVSQSARVMRHGEHGHLDELLSCAALHLELEWEQFFKARDAGPYETTVKDVAANCWYFLPIACAFAAMINSSDVLVETQSDLSRLNNARVRRGNTPLLDHIEISLRLGQGRGEGAAFLHGRSKMSPRLHHVRGHFVQRAGKTFWRTPHLRGDTSRPILQKTVKVNVVPEFAAILARRAG